ncbi:unnamed protein product, partial [Mesorhabditis spiculigera]
MWFKKLLGGMNFDRFLDRFDENTVTKLKRHYWTAKQMFRNKMGKKEDELLTASDADFDSQVTLFNSIKRTSDQLLEASNNYHGFLLDAAQSENGVGKYLKDRGKEQRREETKKVMIAVGRAFLYASHQRAAISQPLLRFYEEICVFNERAIFDCGQTVEAAERAKTEYRGSLLWMKQESEELDPSNFRQMDRFREVQATVRLNKERLDRLKEDTLQKVDLLSASRSHLLSHLLGRYLELLTTYYQKTGTIYATLAKNLSVYDHYDFEILTELIEPSRKAAQKARQESVEKEREEEEQQKAVEAEQPDLMQFNDRDETSLRYLFGGESPSDERIVTDRRRLADDEERPDSPLVGEAEIGMDALEGLQVDDLSNFGPLPPLYQTQNVPKLTPPPENFTQKPPLSKTIPKHDPFDLLSLSGDLFRPKANTDGFDPTNPTNAFQGNAGFSNEWDSLLSQCDLQTTNDLI